MWTSRAGKCVSSWPDLIDPCPSPLMPLKGPRTSKYFGSHLKGIQSRLIAHRSASLISLIPKYDSIAISPSSDDELVACRVEKSVRSEPKIDTSIAYHCHILCELVSAAGKWYLSRRSRNMCKPSGQPTDLEPSAIGFWKPSRYRVESPV